MTQIANDNDLEAAIVIIGSDATVCILNLPERLREIKFEDVGFDDDGFFLSTKNGEKYCIPEGMTAEDYDQSLEGGPFVLRSFQDGEIQLDEYEVNKLPRDRGLSFGV